MELMFVRHGEGEHTSDIPNSLYHSDPALTEEGIKQAESLKNQLPLSDNDILIISPVRRTLSTAFHWSKDVKCRMIAHPLVSPRIFPQVSQGNTLPCDELLDREVINEEFPEVQILDTLPDELWVKGINTISQRHFDRLATEFLDWCKTFDTEKIHIVSHDGTITAYRQLLTGSELTREDFLNETGIIKLYY